jgi:hypothetical protein
MDTNQIFCVLGKIAASTFLTCIPKDYLFDYVDVVKSRISSDLATAFVVNTDASDRPGEHWIAILISSQGHVYWFDSYGFTPGFYGKMFNRFCNMFSNITWSNPHMLQSTVTDVCGEYVVMFIYLSHIGMTPEEIVSLFTINLPHENDRLAVDMIKSLSRKFNLTRDCVLHSRLQRARLMNLVLPSYTQTLH